MPITSGARDGRAGEMQELIDLLRGALDALDRLMAPADIGAHIDNAICRLQEVSGK